MQKKMAQADSSSRQPRRPLYRPFELIGLGVILLVLVVVLLTRPTPANQATAAKLYEDNDVIYEIDFPCEAGMHEIKGHPGFVLEVNDKNWVRVAKSPCHDQICVNTGWLKHPGEQAICLPLKLTLQLEGQESGNSEDDLDAVIGLGENPNDDLSEDESDDKRDDKDVTID